MPTELYQASGYDIQRYYSGTEGQTGMYSGFLYAVPDGAQLDFQVEALVGHTSQRWVIHHPLFPTYGGHFTPAVAYDGTSGWSNTQTITIGESQTLTPSPATTPNEKSQQTEQLERIIGVATIVAALAAGLGLVTYIIKRK